MKHNALKKDFFVELRKTKNRFFSILLIVVLGVAFFSGIRAASPDMNLSADQFYDDSNFMDLRILSSLGLTDEDVEAVSSIEGVSSAEGGYSADVLCDLEDAQIVVRLMSVPESMNEIQIEEGRLPENNQECLVDTKFITNTGYQIGDTIKVASGTEDDIKDTVKETSYKIVGSGSIPYYLSLDRGTTKIGNGNLNSFIFLPKDCFAIEAYTELCLTVTGARELLDTSDAYEDLVGEVQDRLEDISEERCQARYDGIQEEGRDKIADAKKEIADNEQKLADAAKELEDGQAKLEDGKKEIAENEQKLADGKQELDDNEAVLLEGRSQIDDGYAQIEDAEEQLDEKQQEIYDGWEQIEANEQTLKEKQQEYESGLALYEEGEAKTGEQIEAAWKEWNDGKEALDGALASAREQAKLQAREQAEQSVRAAMEESLKAAVEAGLMTQEEADAQLAAAISAAQESAVAEAMKAIESQFADPYGELEKNKKIIEENEAAARQQLSVSKKELEEGKAQLYSGWEQLDAARAELEDGQSQLNGGWEELSGQAELLEEKEAEWQDGKQKLSDAEEEWQDGVNQLRDAKQELKDKEQELLDGKQEYEEAKEKAEPEIADAKSKIQDAEKELRELELPEWYVLDRNYIESYVEYHQDSQRIEAIGKVFPVIFFLVAALICLTSMTRMVEEERIQIGTLKALGYGKFSIAAKYICYAFSATMLGSLTGLVLGQKLLPVVIINAYGILYTNLPQILNPLHLSYSLSSTAAAIFCTVAATVFACYKELNACPAELMRPAAPKSGKRVLLERIGILWRHLNFTNKSTIRNLFRYKKRFFMTVLGIGGCMGLLLVGFGLKDSIKSIGTLQFGSIRNYSASIAMKDDVTEEEENQLLEIVKNDKEIKNSLSVCESSVDVGSKGTEKSSYMVIPQEPGRLTEFISLRDRLTKKPYELTDDGVIITEKLAKLLDVKAGDEIYLKKDETHKLNVKVSHITENYFYHYVYITPALYEKKYQEEPEFHQIYTINSSDSEKFEEEFQRRYMEKEQVTEISFLSGLADRIADMLKSMDTVIYVLVISAGMLAFIVLYNLNTINLSERMRELATLKVLGFYDMEVSSYMIRENIWLTLIGSIVGVIFGRMLHYFVILTAEIDIMMFGRNIEPKSYIFSIILTFFFSFLVNFAMHFKLKKINMVESMKSVE